MWPTAASYEVIWPNTLSAAHEMRKPKISPRKMAIRLQKPGSNTLIRSTAVMVMSAIHGSCGQ